MARHSDALFHPAFLDPRWTAALNPYEEIPPPAHRPTEAPANETRSRNFDIKHIRLELKIDPAEAFIEGVATVKLAPFRDGLETLEFDAAELNVREVRRGKQALEFESFTEKLIVVLDERLRRGQQVELRISYTARPRRGLYFIAPDEEYPNKPVQVWSQGEAEDNHAWFPCTDSPNQRQTTETVVNVPERFKVLSNGKLISEKHDARGARRTFHWRQAEPHPAYLVSIVIGEYVEITARGGDKLPITYHTYPGTEREARRLFGKTPEMVRHFSKLFGYEYPYPKYAQVVVDDFIYGAMENTSITTCTDRCLHDATTALDFNYQDLVAHELAHQWWGDLLTPKSWKHTWLKESFATYAESLWLEHAAGSDEARFSMIQDFNIYLAEDRDRYRRPIVFDRYDFPVEIYDRHAYQKGGLVLCMLRHVLGDDAFFRTLAHYAHKHEWQSVETNDLKVAIEEVTGQNLDWFFDQWLYGRGYPEFEVNHHYDGENRSLRLNVKQVQETRDSTPLFRMPVEVEVISQASSRTFWVQVEKAEHEFHFAVDERPLVVLFDGSDRVLKTLRHEKSKQELLHQLVHAKSFTARMRAARDLEVFKDEETVGALRRALLQDGFGAVRMAAAVALAGRGNDEARNALVESLEKNEETRVRRATAWALGRFRQDQAAIAALSRAIRHDASYYVTAFAMRALAHAAGEDAYEALIGVLGRDSYQDVLRATVFDALAIAKDRRGIALAIDHTAYGVHPAVRVAAAMALGNLGKEYEDEREKVYQKLVKLLEDKAFRVRLAAVKALAVLGDERAVAPLRATEQREAIHILKSAARESIRVLEEKARKGRGDGKKEE
ncbi:MAG TPA: M1 family aminopeptidase [Pyrinomonadaceae bacterium]|nr:M1 family aminopeptidase [Pyrinomonadaceae bacterium]